MVEERSPAFDGVRHAHLVIAQEEPGQTVAANLRIEEILDVVVSSRCVLAAFHLDSEFSLKLARFLAGPVQTRFQR